jgi:muramoyltetrapeptide carboxypeptidase LdcA involved in peptidoglycan recycling
MKKLVFAGLLGAAALFSTGCGANACEKAAQRIEDRLRACGLNVEEGEGDGGMECTEANAATQERLADCAEKASCDSVKTGAWLSTCGT